MLELYAGVGGLAAALGPAAEIVAAVDINRSALEVYGHNFDHPRMTGLVEGLDAAELAALDADLWWASPPCQPFTRRGRRLDLDDPRAQTFKAFVDRIVRVRPRYLAMENVVGFESSAARDLLRSALDGAGYGRVREEVICPSELGWPNRRPRYYLVASRGAMREVPRKPPVRRNLAPLLDAADDPDLLLPEATARRYRHAIDVVERGDPGAISGCFTSAYGR
ncbi:MAG: DNA cytosine methyltransferase, partial [Acidobacteriota bacterium]